MSYLAAVLAWFRIATSTAVPTAVCIAARTIERDGDYHTTGRALARLEGLAVRTLLSRCVT